MTLSHQWRFPRVKFVSENGALQQARHVLSEANEVRKEIGGYFTDSEGEVIYKIADWGRVDEEMADLLHSVETYFRIRQEFNLDIAAIFSKVETKNRERGYYD